MVTITLNISNYELEWVEQALLRQDRGNVVDDGTLATLGQILLDNVNL